jgi:hypothetical protein
MGWEVETAKKVAATVAAAGVLAAIAGGWSHYETSQGMQREIQEHDEAIDGTPEKPGILASLVAFEQEKQSTYEQNTEILQMLKQNRALLLTKRGRAAVGNWGPDEAFIRINTRGAADVYRNFKWARVTIGDITERLPIKGEIKGSPLGPMIVISLKAAARFGVPQHGEIGGVMIEPDEGEAKP